MEKNGLLGQQMLYYKIHFTYYFMSKTHLEAYKFTEIVITKKTKNKPIFKERKSDESQRL